MRPFEQTKNSKKKDLKPQVLIQDDDDDIIEIKYEEMQVSSLPLKIQVSPQIEKKYDFYLTSFLTRKMLFQFKITILYRTKAGYCVSKDCEHYRSIRHRHYLIESNNARPFPVLKEFLASKNQKFVLIESKELVELFVKRYDLIVNKH